MLRAHPGLVAIAFVISVVEILLSSLKLNLVLAALGTPVRFTATWSAYYVGTFFNNFIPTSIGGDLVKVLELNKIESTDLAGNGLSVMVERISGIAVLLALAGGFVLVKPGWYRAVGLSFLQDGRLWLYAVLGLSVVAVLLNFVLRDEREDPPIWKTRLQEGLAFPVEFPGTSALVVLLSVFFHGLRAFNFVLLAWALGHDINISVVLFVLPIIAFASFLPISMGGIGLREGIITFCLHTFGLPLGVSLSLSLLIRVFSVVHSVAGGCVFLLESNPATPPGRAG